MADPNTEKQEAINRHVECLHTAFEIESRPLSIPTTFSGMPRIKIAQEAQRGSLEKVGDNLYIFRQDNLVNLIIHSVSVEIK